MKNLNHFPLDIESNIYCLASLEFADGKSKLLVATLECQIFCISYDEDFDPQIKSVDFTYIPSGARIISIDALKRGPNDFVIGITHSLTKVINQTSSNSINNEVYNRQHSYYLNIYASGPSSPDHFDIDYAAQGCQTIRLRYVPYQLYSTDIVTVDHLTSSFKSRPCWLLSGGDASIHTFIEDDQRFKEITIDDCFPELSAVSNIVIWIDIHLEKSSDKYDRFTALGYENGSVYLFHTRLLVEQEFFQIIRKSSYDSFTTIVPSVRLFRKKDCRKSRICELMDSRGMDTSSLLKQRWLKKESLELLAVSSTENSIIFHDVVHNGLDKYSILPQSKRIDCMLSSAIGDIDYDGFNEIMLGNYNHELLIYNYNSSTCEYSLSRIRDLNFPISSIKLVDLTGDSLDDVVLLTSGGVSVMQTLRKDLISKLETKVEKLLKILLHQNL